MYTMLKMGSGLVLLAVMAGCGGSDDLSSRVPNSIPADSAVLNDSGTISQSALNATYELRGVNSDGDAGVVRVSWSLTDSGFDTLRSNSRVRLRELRDGQPGRVIDSRAVSEESPSGVFDVPVDTTADIETRWRLELDRADLTAVPGITNFTVVNLESILRRSTTDLSRLRSVELSLVEDSYTAENIDNRREHNFSVSVAGHVCNRIGE